MSTLLPPENLKLDLPLQQIAAICRKHDVAELSVFGSVLRDDFRSDSDVDFLVVFRGNNAGPWLAKYQQMEEELAQLLGRRVEVVSRRAVEQSRNYLRRHAILSSARVLYAA
jgi:predicted nucleotidyltransferase